MNVANKRNDVVQLGALKVQFAINLIIALHETLHCNYLIIQIDY
jgi:hypothetical protein